MIKKERMKFRIILWIWNIRWEEREILDWKFEIKRWKKGRERKLGREKEMKIERNGLFRGCEENEEKKKEKKNENEIM